jgi:hypothetical protein
MPLPIQRSYTVTTTALNVPVNMIDDDTGLTQWLILQPNVLQDLVMNPDSGVAGVLLNFTLIKNGTSTPVRGFSSSMSPTTQGRVPIGNVSLSNGQYQFSAVQTAGAVPPTNSILARYAAPLN